MAKEIQLNKENNAELDNFRLFDPKLSELHDKAFIKIVKAVKNELPARRVELIDKALNPYINSENLDETKFAATLSIFKDLITQEWRIKIKEEKVYLAPSKLINKANKLYLRQQLQIEKNSHLNKVTNVKFVKKLEETKKYNNQEISIKNLIGSPTFILSALKENTNKEKIVLPYIQIVDKSRCIHTGYKLNEIWRYFRYTWSIPYKSTPGRNIFYLVRDAAQPYHPVIGISALGNSVLQLSKRDNYIGWTLESIKYNLMQKHEDISLQINVKGLIGSKRLVSQKVILENEMEYNTRVTPYSIFILEKSLNSMIVTQPFFI